MAIVFFHLFRAGRSTKPRVEMDPKSSTHGFGETGAPGQVSSPRNLAIYAVPMGTKKVCCVQQRKPYMKQPPVESV